jgi:hypothetical protein
VALMVDASRVALGRRLGAGAHATVYAAALLPAEDGARGAAGRARPGGRLVAKCLDRTGPEHLGQVGGQCFEAPAGLSCAQCVGNMVQPTFLRLLCSLAEQLAAVYGGLASVVGMRAWEITVHMQCCRQTAATARQHNL